MRARKDEGEGVLREGILGSSAQFVRAVGEKLLSEKLFSKLGCLREELFSRNRFAQNHSMRPDREVVLGEVVLLEDVLRAPTF